MTNRTIQFYGSGYGNAPVSITAIANGNTVFSGTINTVNEPIPTGWPDPAEFSTIFTMELPVSFSGSIPMTVVANSGEGVAMAHVRANYTSIPNPVYSSEQWAVISVDPRSAESLGIETALASPPFSQTEIDTLSDPSTSETNYYLILNQHGVLPYVPGGAANFSANFWQGDCRTSVTLDGASIEPPSPRPPEQNGDWTYVAPVNSTLAYTLNVEAGVE